MRLFEVVRQAGQKKGPPGKYSKNKKDFPNLELDVAKTEITEEEAYRLTYSIGQGTWANCYYEENGGGIVKYYKFILNHCGYFAICGAKGCIRACMDSLEKCSGQGKLYRMLYLTVPFC